MILDKIKDFGYILMLIFIFFSPNKRKYLEVTKKYKKFKL
tara:strand:+ start:565 stop:684 length:120 start_codon:yes stop_codon:yes gene_type:complete